jgi:GNAT superfamily N-acetyltransferase
MPRRKLPSDPPPNQPAITTFYRPLDYWFDRTIRQHNDGAFQHLAVQFRQQYEKVYTTWVYLGTFNSYCFYRNADFTEYHAYSPRQQGQKAGEAFIDDEYFLTGLYVELDFRRQKIAYHLIRLANETMQPAGERPRLLILIGQRHQHTRQYPEERYLTHEGWALIQYCRQQRLLQSDQLIGTTPYTSPKKSQDYYEY